MSLVKIHTLGDDAVAKAEGFAILAGKPTNKAKQSAAESVERRVEAKGNTGQQSTHRAQDRESVSQALDHIRRVARHRKKEKFTALFHHITAQLLREAFFELKENAAPRSGRAEMGRLRSFTP